MGIKAQELIDGCFAKAALDEPLFVLRSTDKLAPDMVRKWAEEFRKKHLRRETQGKELAKAILKYEEALEVAAKMEAWPSRKLPD